MSTHPGNDLSTGWKALWDLLDEPDETAHAFRLIEKLPGLFYPVVGNRFTRTEEGKDLMRERPQLLDILNDRDGLHQMPEGSLGRAYLAFVEREQISAGGLVDASEGEYTEGLSEQWLYVKDRIRDQHDIWHALLGYEGDLIGEASILAFSFAQTGNLGIGFLVGAALLKQGPFAGKKGSGRVIAGGLLRGVRAKWLGNKPWEELLRRPLADVRRELGVTEPPSYTPAHTKRVAQA